MSIRISPNLPANVVEIGNEISQAKIDEINAGTLATQTWVSNIGYLTDATGSINNDGVPYARANNGWTSISQFPEAPSDGSTYGRKDGAWETVTSGISDAPSDGSTYGRKDGAWESITSGISDAPSDGNTYARKDAGWVVSNSADPKKAIANLAAGCFYYNGPYVFFNGGIAVAVQVSSKFTGSSQYRLGYGAIGSSLTIFTLSMTTNSNGDTIASTGVGYISVIGQTIAYSDDYGTTWTYSDYIF